MATARVRFYRLPVSAGALVALAAAISLSAWLVLRRRTHTIVIDLSATRSASQVSLGGNTQWIDDYAGIDQVDIDLRLPGHRPFRGYVQEISFHREEGMIDLVSVICPRETTDEAYGTARTITAEWNLPEEKLTRLRQSPRSLDSELQIIRNDLVPAVELRIVPTVDPSKPVCIMVDFSWQLTAPTR